MRKTQAQGFWQGLTLPAGRLPPHPSQTQLPPQAEYRRTWVSCVTGSQRSYSVFWEPPASWKLSVFRQAVGCEIGWPLKSSFESQGMPDLLCNRLFTGHIAETPKKVSRKMLEGSSKSRRQLEESRTVNGASGFAAAGNGWQLFKERLHFWLLQSSPDVAHLCNQSLDSLIRELASRATALLEPSLQRA